MLIYRFDRVGITF